jgi:hypothetical protein
MLGHVVISADTQGVCRNFHDEGQSKSGQVALPLGIAV